MQQLVLCLTQTLDLEGMLRPTSLRYVSKLHSHTWFVQGINVSEPPDRSDARFHQHGEHGRFPHLCEIFLRPSLLLEEEDGLVEGGLQGACMLHVASSFGLLI